MWSLAANGQMDTSLGKISYSGSACPQGSVVASLDNTKARLSLSFQQYSVDSKGRNQRGILKDCKLLVPIHMQPGWSVSLVDASYRGNIAIPQGASVKLVNTWSLSGHRGQSFRVNFSGPREQAYQLKDPLSSLASVWSGCGNTALLRVTTSMRVKSPTDDSPLQVADDFSARLKFRRCR